MPNYVTNRVRYNKRGDEIKQKIFNGKDVNFGIIIPMPKELNITYGGIQKSAIQYALYKLDKDEQNKIIDTLRTSKENYYDKFLKQEVDKKTLETEAERFEKELKREDDVGLYNMKLYNELGIKTFEDLGMRYLDNILEYGYDTWYDWSVDNWGTKWNACDTYYCENDETEFTTAWSCPLEWLLQLSKVFEDVEFDIEYANEDVGLNCGRFMLLNGKVHNYEDRTGDYEFALRVQGYDDEGIAEWFEENEENGDYI